MTQTHSSFGRSVGVTQVLAGLKEPGAHAKLLHTRQMYCRDFVVMVNTLLTITAASQLLIHSSLFPGWLSMQAKQIDISRDTLRHFVSYFQSFMSLKVYEYTSESLFSVSGVVLYSLQTQWLQLCQFMCNAHRNHLLSFSFLKGMESTLLSQIFACAFLVKAL